MTDVFSDHDLAKIERSTQRVGREILGQLGNRHSNVFQRRWWEDRILEWAMRDPSVKLQMFRFIDVLPMLDDSDSVVEHLQEYFQDAKRMLPSAARLGMSLAKPGTVAGRAMAMAARRNAQSHARRFIAGTTAEQVLKAVRRQRALGRAFTLDVLGEAVISEQEADRYLRAYIDLIENIAPIINRLPIVPQIDHGVYSDLPRVNISVKLSAFDSRFDPIDPVGTIRRVGERLRKLLRVAREHGAFVNVDMESYYAKDLTLRIFREILDEEEFRQVRDIGIVIQCYLKDAGKDLAELLDWVRRRGAPVWVRLVKGAYWDYETVHSSANGWPVPVYEQKWETDACFEQQTRFLIRHWEHLRPALGSHNMRSIAHAIAVAEHAGMPPDGLELQMLYGMADDEKDVLVARGHRMRVYMPYGELIPGMAYLVRRLLENTSNDSFLRASFAEQLPVEVLLAPPHPKDSTIQPKTDRPEQNPMAKSDVQDHHSDSLGAVFQNEPPLDFASADNRKKMQAAIESVAEQLGKHYPLRIGDREEDSPDRIISLNPAEPKQIVGTAPAASVEQTDSAVAAAKKALPAWSAMPVEDRCRFLHDAAEVMLQRRFELAAWEIYECGKPWREADGDITEAIDFCRYYAEGAVTMNLAQGADVAGEENRFDYLPRGVVAVIAPWNFPLAILTGMTVAALATGNTVVIKPAEQSPVIGAKLMAIFDELGLPPGVLNFLPGRGEVVGARLVEHPDVSLIAFTGSRDVGLAINARAAEVSRDGSSGVKRVIAEMGGKNAIIVDDDADLDEAVLAVVQSAFGFQGQKCSACSRCIVLEKIYEPFLKRLVEATRSLIVGLPNDPATKIGPVIDQEAMEQIVGFIEIGKSEGTTALAVDVAEWAGSGFFVGPHIFSNISQEHRIAREEIFGPVLSVMRARDFDQAIEIANDTDYALTAGLFSRSPNHLDRARRELAAGNIYLNRPITGALVGRHPFGGYRLSGIGSKAGGPDYLYQFVIPRAVSENTMRRGFAPE